MFICKKQKGNKIVYVKIQIIYYSRKTVESQEKMCCSEQKND